MLTIWGIKSLHSAGAGMVSSHGRVVSMAMCWPLPPRWRCSAGCFSGSCRRCTFPKSTGKRSQRERPDRGPGRKAMDASFTAGGGDGAGRRTVGRRRPDDRKLCQGHERRFGLTTHSLLAMSLGLGTKDYYSDIEAGHARVTPKAEAIIASSSREFGPCRESNRRGLPAGIDGRRTGVFALSGGRRKSRESGPRRLLRGRSGLLPTVNMRLVKGVSFKTAILNPLPGRSS